MSMGGIGGIGKDPNEIAKLFAKEAGISVGDAKQALKEEYGDPVQDAAGSVFDFNMPKEGSNIDLSSLLNDSGFEQNQSEQNGASNFLQEIMNMFKGNNGPQKANDSLSKDQGFGMGSGQQKAGDPQPHLGQIGGMPQEQGGSPNQAEEIKEEFNFFIEE